MRACTLLMVGLLAQSVIAQGPSWGLRYDPVPGRIAQSLVEMRTVVTMNGLPAVPDGMAVETEIRLYAVEQVLGLAPAGGLRVRVGVDSVRARMRDGEGAWRDLDPPALAGHQAVAAVDERLHITAIESATTPEDGAILRALTGWSATLGFTMPDSAVQPGITFRPDAQLPFEVTLDANTGLPLREVLLGDIQMTLDSVVARGADTLAYLRFGGQFAPRTIESTGEMGTRSDTFEGAFVGSLLWSTGWDAFVSGSMRARVIGRLHEESAAGVVDATVQFDATQVHRVRP